YASDTSNRAGDGAVLEMTLAAPINCGRIRVNADYGYGIVDSVTIDVLKDGLWQNVYVGAINDAAYGEIAFAPGKVSAARFHYHYTQGGYYFWLYEFGFYDSPLIVVPPTVQTNSVTDPEQTTAIVHGKI